MLLRRRLRVGDRRRNGHRRGDAVASPSRAANVVVNDCRGALGGDGRGGDNETPPRLTDIEAGEEKPVQYYDTVSDFSPRRGRIIQMLSTPSGGSTLSNNAGHRPRPHPGEDERDDSTPWWAVTLKRQVQLHPTRIRDDARGGLRRIVNSPRPRVCGANCGRPTRRRQGGHHGHDLVWALELARHRITVKRVAPRAPTP